jgi:hypothetical protein
MKAVLDMKDYCRKAPHSDDLKMETSWTSNASLNMRLNS